MEREKIALALRYQPVIFHDEGEPFPVRCIGCTVFDKPMRSESFPKCYIDPQAEGAAFIVEYAIYYDYDIQHLYDLEHIWVAVDSRGQVSDCWCSFHGMRLRAAGVASFRVEGGHPVLYAQPGKHAMLPDPALFALHPQFHTACGKDAGGGLLIPGMLEGVLTTDSVRDERIARYIREQFAFTPTGRYLRQVLKDSQFVSWQTLLEVIPALVEEQLKIIEA